MPCYLVKKLLQFMLELGIGDYFTHLKSKSSFLNKLWFKDSIIIGEEGKLLDISLGGKRRHEDLNCPR